MRARKASIQTAATKVTNMLYLSSGVRLLRSLKNQNSSHILRTAHEVNPHCIVTENDVLP